MNEMTLTNIRSGKQQKSTKATAKPGIKELIGAYEFSNRAEGKSPRTIAWYGELLSAFIKYVWKEWDSDYLSHFNLKTVRGYVLYLQQKPKFSEHPFTPEQAAALSPRTVQCHVRALKAFSTWLYAEGHTDENRLKILKLPKAPVTIMEPLTTQEIEKITSSIDKKSRTGSRNYAIVATMLDSGLRASGVASISLGNLNIKDGFIKVTGKGNKERVVPIGEHVRRVLWSYIEKVRPEPASPGFNNLFLTTDGQPLTVNTIKLLFTRMAKSSGVARLHAHLCRHTFAINYLLNGGDIFSLKEILGHTTLEMVAHYLHFTTSQITSQHHKFSPMDKLYGK